MERQRVRNGNTKERNGDTNGAAGGGTMNGHLPSPERKMHSDSVLMYIIHHYLTPLFLIVFSPNLVLIMWYTVRYCEGSYQLLYQRMTEHGLCHGLHDMWSKVSIGSPTILYIILAYSLFAVILQVTLPGPRAEGPVTPKGHVPVYTDNGFLCYIVTMVALVALTIGLKQYGLSPTIVYDRFDEFLGTMTIISLLFCFFLYLKGIYYPSTKDCGSSGNFIFDFYWGTELYPRVFGVDIKVFTNCRFGMTVWPVLVLIFAIKSYELHGFVDSIWVSTALQLIYLTKFFWWEAGYMRTIDIMVDRAGFYICWGCLVYIAGIYASVSLYMVEKPVYLGTTLSTVILLLGTAAIAINYNADWQKQEVRRTDGKCLIWGRKPDVIRAKYVLENGEQRESILLVSGWWGVARHFHYIPELLLAFSWSVPALFTNIMPYTYVIWLVLLLSHRTLRDDHKCGHKYKDYWSEYCRRVPYRMLPYVF